MELLMKDNLHRAVSLMTSTDAKKPDIVQKSPSIFHEPYFHWLKWLIFMSNSSTKSTSVAIYLRVASLCFGAWRLRRTKKPRSYNKRRVLKRRNYLGNRGIPSLWLVTVFLGLESSTSLWKITYPKFLRYSKITRILVSRKVEQPCFFLHFFPDFLTFFIWWFLKVLPLLFEKKIWQTLCVKLKGTLLQLALKPSWLLNSKT